MKKTKHRGRWLWGTLALVLIGLLAGLARTPVQAVDSTPGTGNQAIGVLTAHQILTIYDGVGPLAKDTGTALQPGDKADVNVITQIGGSTWLDLGGNRWLSLDPQYNPTYESRFWTRTTASIYQGFGDGRTKTSDEIKGGSGDVVTAYVDWNGTPWYQVGKTPDRWVTTAAQFNPPVTENTLQLSFTTTVYTGSGADRKATTKTLPALSTITYTKTETVGTTPWYNIGGDEWVTTDPAYNPGFEQYLYVPSQVPVWTDYTASRTKTTQVIPANSTQVLQGTAVQDGVKWYKLGPNQWITLDSATNDAGDHNPVPPASTKHVVTLLKDSLVFREPAGTSSGRTLKTGTQWQYFHTQTVGGVTWYNLGVAQWVTNGQDTSGWTKQKSPIQFPILMYHELRSDEPDNTWSVPSDQFATQMQWLRNNGYYFLNTQEAYTVLTTNQAPSDKIVWVTMDDGYESWFTKGLPIIQQYGVHGTMFMITNTGTLTQQQAEIMKANGMDIESHTLNHLHLSQLPDYQQKQEMLGTKTYLDSTYHQDTTAIAYPFGDYNETTEKEAAAIGYSMALRIHGGLASSENGLYSLNRIKVSPNLTTEQFQYLVEHGEDEAAPDNDNIVGPPVLK